MSLINLDFMQRYQTKLDTAIKTYVTSKLGTAEGTSIATGTDMNDFTTAGNYRVPSDAIAGNISNLPLALCGKVLVVDMGNGGILQLYLSNHTPRMFKRTLWGNAWTNWDELVAMSDIAPLLCTETTAGTYILKATVASGGAVTYSWVAEN